ncbi:MAG TPA: glycosyltransferase [Alphaproteobacteria bacterium]|nr:glycosyltransferase [Alphaproteobacteria bacterium]
MRRVLYLVQEYPQISETYIKTEIDRVKRRFNVSVAATRAANLPYDRHEPFEILKETGAAALAELVRKHRPDIVHGHYFHLAPMLLILAREAGTYFTVRTHSFDVLTAKTLARKEVIAAVNDPACRGVLCFPFLTDRLVKAGVAAGKIVPCWPVVDIPKFRNRAPNGPDVMDVGAALPKKAMHLFVDFAKMFPEMKFDLYMLGYDAGDIEAYARKTGSPVNIIPPRQPEDMPLEYKKHRWMLYTASKKLNTVGWPLSAAEAQASGVGVLVQNIRSDIAEYVGPGGYVFDTVEDVRRIISQPFPEERREAAFLHAEKSNIDGHVDLLYRLWM